MHGVRVTKFYAPSKARCPGHGGADAYEELEWSGDSSMSHVPKDLPEVKDEDAYVNLNCPFCGGALSPMAVHERFGHLVLECSGCQIVTEIRADWRVLQVRRIPAAWEEIVEKLAGTQTRVDLTGGW